MSFCPTKPRSRRRRVTKPELRLDSKVALVTGGTKGIGRATVLTFLGEGAAVIFTASGHELGPPMEDDLRKQGHDARFIRCDSRADGQVKDLVAQIVALHGRLDIAVNNVGSTAPTDSLLAMLHETPLEAFQDTMDMALR